MKIKVLGSGCPTCKKFYEKVSQAVNELKLNEKVEYVVGEDGMKALIEAGAMTSPALVVNEKIVITGSVTDVNRIKEILSENLR